MVIGRHQTIDISHQNKQTTPIRIILKLKKKDKESFEEIQGEGEHFCTEEEK
jgi:hypothetical protein